MAHFSEIEDSIVTQVIVVADTSDDNNFYTWDEGLQTWLLEHNK
jgi:hypothetical protein